MKEWTPSFRSVSIKMNPELSAEMKQALIANFPPNFGKDIFTDSDGGAAPVTTGNKGDDNRKYINWGADNRLPLEIVKRAYLSPYVAPSLNHIINSIYSEGIKPYYVYYRYENGAAKREQIDYEAAGGWLRNRIRELKASGNQPKPSAYSSEPQPAVPDYAEEIAQLKADLKQWEATFAKWKAFEEANDLSYWLHEVATDLAYFWNWFPTVELPIGKKSEAWKPEIIHLRHLEACCTRKGIMNKLGQIDYCVFSREFGGQVEARSPIDDPEKYYKQIVIDALDPHTAVSQLRKNVADQSTKGLGARVTRYVIPMRIPTPGKPYYAKPTWYSIFISGIYYYLLALLNQRATRLANGVMFSYIIHLNEQYIRYEEERAGVENGTPEEKLKVYNELVNELQSWLKKNDNDGKALVAVSKNIDGKTVKWVEIEPLDRSKDDTTVKEDIAEIANVILYAMGIHPQTVGAIPGKDKVASGTEARELNTLQQLDLFAFKIHLMRPLYLIKSFNEWDDHLYFDIPVHVLTTLDKNKRGVEEMKNSE
ncbi:MAG: hypothetical protein LBQ39_10825 [Tannerellaceae bacterium]|jgi:hypothetical protein|nr:hypothetical protein [Tannerellaceae bacterium]